jgi:hypothetical protein
MQRAIWPVVTLCLMVLSFAAGRVIFSLNGLPDIVATLPGDESEFSRELNVRIREQFPMGTSEETLLAFLKGEGFAPDWRQRNEPNASVFVHNGLLCKKIVRVFWHADSAGVLMEDSATYESLCL